MLVSQGGNLKVNGKNIGVQAICLEEDAAKLLKDEQNERNYSLDRLGIPLVEIALEPVSTKPSEVKEIALTLGGLLRATRMVKRGIGSIRQDVNISVMNSGVVEVKGVQQLDQLEKIINYEAKRQHGLILIAEKLKTLSITITKEDVVDVTEIFKACDSKIIQKAQKLNAKIKAIRIRNFSGMFGFEPYPEIRLGKEIGQLVRFFGIGGVFHSDELPNYGINDSDVDKVRKHLELAEEDGFLIIAGEDPKLDYAIASIIKRIQDATDGVPAETRAATQDGETIFLRPRPGASRMYPETDIPSISVTPQEMKLAMENIPPSLESQYQELEKKYHLNPELAKQLWDSPYLDSVIDVFRQDWFNMKSFEDAKKAANFIASKAVSLKSFEREGLDLSKIDGAWLSKTLGDLADHKIAKERFEQIFRAKISGEEEPGSPSKFRVPSEDELNKILDKIIQDNMDLPEVKEGGEHAVKKLMGIFMKEYRGTVDGKLVHDLLRKKVSEL
jgi:glutamyl-tRNA(Gln) amidotransferase subunit E